MSDENNRIDAKKSLGQNFLASHGIIDKIVASAELSDKDTVLEVGPGKGALTEKLLATGAFVVAVEKDDRLIAFLSEKFGLLPNFSLVHADILEVMNDLSKLNPQFSTDNYAVVANLPYYITGIFLQKLCESSHPPTKAILMLQKEVADRILRRDGKESILSLAIEAYGTASLVCQAPRGAFVPSPNVDSTVVKISNISKDFFKKAGISEEAFFETVKTGFAHKRKLLRGNLGLAEGVLTGLGITENARAE